MSAVQRFFRRYIVSTVGIVILFLAVNLALFVAIILTGSMSGADTSFSVRDFSDHVVMQDEKWVADDAALSMLQEQSAWAMLLDEDVDVVWQQDLPENLPRSYTSTEVASFSRWYLDGQIGHTVLLSVCFGKATGFDNIIAHVRIPPFRDGLSIPSQP